MKVLQEETKKACWTSRAVKHSEEEEKMTLGEMGGGGLGAGKARRRGVSETTLV